MRTSHAFSVNKKSGFTLVELLVSISIIAILSVIGLNLYQSVYKTARDTKRRSDIKFIQSALEQYHADQKYYPYSVTPGGALSSPDGSKVYMNKVPQDPGTTPYLYLAAGTGCSSDATAASCSGYCLYAQLENATGITSDTGCTPLPIGYNIGVTRP